MPPSSLPTTTKKKHTRENRSGGEPLGALGILAGLRKGAETGKRGAKGVERHPVRCVLVVDDDLRDGERERRLALGQQASVGGWVRSREQVGRRVQLPNQRLGPGINLRRRRGV